MSKGRFVHFLSQWLPPVPGSVEDTLSREERNRAVWIAYGVFGVGFVLLRWTFHVADGPADARGSFLAPLIALVAALASVVILGYIQYRQGMSPSASRPPGSPPGVLLIVEDHEVIGEQLRRRYSARGWSVRLARTLAEGLAALADRPAAVVLDLMLPDGPGERILQQARFDRLGCRVLVNTGIDDPDREATLIEMGADAVVKKGADLGVLDRAVGLPGERSGTR